jgi:hypothetical protein
MYSDLGQRLEDIHELHEQIDKFFDSALERFRYTNGRRARALFARDAGISASLPCQFPALPAGRRFAQCADGTDHLLNGGSAGGYRPVFYPVPSYLLSCL